jgi:hypothetical protein
LILRRLDRNFLAKAIRIFRAVVVVAFILFHVGALVLTASRLTGFIPRHKITRPLLHLVTLYAKLTLNNQRFTFFAPFVPTWPTLSIVCTDKSGKKRAYKFPIPNREVEVRYNKMIRNYTSADLRPELFRSWASYIKATNPDVAGIEISLWENDTPTMENYRNGARQSVKLLYKEAFSY